jgi:hypothetical protein
VSLVPAEGGFFSVILRCEQSEPRRMTAAAF